MIEDKNKSLPIANYLHLGLKAGKIRLGMSAACSSCIKNKAALVICAGDMSSNSLKKIERITQRQRVKCIKYGEKRLYSDLFQRTTTGIVCIEDKNLASGILKILS